MKYQPIRAWWHEHAGDRPALRSPARVLLHITYVQQTRGRARRFRGNTADWTGVDSSQSSSRSIS
jgi:hypothetical protein